MSSRIYYVFADDLPPDAGKPIGGGWRLLEVRETPDGAHRCYAAWNPATGERFIYSAPSWTEAASMLSPGGPRPLAVNGRRRRH
jgi:hypothetical protein